MDMIGRIRRLHSRGKKSEREIARLTGAVAQHGSQVAARAAGDGAEVPAPAGGDQARAVSRDLEAGAARRCPAPHECPAHGQGAVFRDQGGGLRGRLHAGERYCAARLSLSGQTNGNSGRARQGCI